MADVDVGKELYEQIKKKFDDQYKNHYLLQSILKKIESGKASPDDVCKYAQCVGSVLANSIMSTVSPDKLPDGRLYYNIADTILSGTLHDNYELVNIAAARVQENIDNKINLSIKVQKADFPTERVKKVIGAASDETADFPTAMRRMTAASQTITKSFNDDFVEANAEFRARAGLKCYLTRKLYGEKTCEFCSRVAGKFVYGEHPKDIFRRHDNCDCVVTYYNERGESQQVWSKKSWSDEEELEYLKKLDAEKSKKLFPTKGQLARRKALSDSKQPKPLSREQGKRIEAEKLAKSGLTKSENGDIILSESKLKIDMQFFGSPDFSKQRTAGLKKTIRSLEERIEEHKQKTINPEKFYPDWDKFSEREKNGFIKHWRKEISNFETQIVSAKEELKKRGV